MITVKLSYPSKWDKDWGGLMFAKETPAGSAIWGNYKFEINNGASECDYWLIYDDIDQYLFETVHCPRANVIFITGEVVEYWGYPQKFLDQFGAICTARQNIKHRRLLHTRHTCVWHIRKSFDYLKNLEHLDKTKNLSTVTSNATLLDGHKQRYAFVNRLKGHFKDELNWYGRGEVPIDDKWDALKDFKYSIAIENSSHWGYYTEKIMDCYLSLTMPLYFGCPNILDYFEQESLVIIDPGDYKKSIKLIEACVESDLYKEKLPAIKRMRDKILNETSFFPFVVHLLESLNNVSTKKNKVLLRSREYYEKPKTLRQSLYRNGRLTYHHLNGYW